MNTLYLIIARCGSTLVMVRIILAMLLHLTLLPQPLDPMSDCHLLPLRPRPLDRMSGCHLLPLLSQPFDPVSGSQLVANFSPLGGLNPMAVLLPARAYINITILNYSYSIITFGTRKNVETV